MDLSRSFLLLIIFQLFTKGLHSITSQSKCGFAERDRKQYVHITPRRLESATIICSNEVEERCNNVRISVALYKNNNILGEKFETGRRIEYKYRIKSTQTSDYGVYHCVFDSDHDRLNTTVYVNISDWSQNMDLFLPEDKESIRQDYLYLDPIMKNVLLVKHLQLKSSCLFECKFFSPREHDTLRTFWIKHQDKTKYITGIYLKSGQMVNISSDDTCNSTGTNLVGKCVYSSLKIFDITNDDHAFYTCLMESVNGSTRSPYLTFSLMVDATITHGNNKYNSDLPEIEFSPNSSVCFGRNFSIFCAADDSNLKMYLYKVHPTTDLTRPVLYMNDSILLKVRFYNATELSELNEKDRGLIDNNIWSAYINYSLTSLSPNDTGRYLCVIEDILEMSIKWKSMYLSVGDCSLFGMYISTNTKYVYVGVSVNLMFLLVICVVIIVHCKHRNDKIKRFPIRKLILVEYESPIYKSFFNSTKDTTIDSPMPGSNPIMSPIIRIKPLKRSLEYFRTTAQNEQHPSTSTDRTHLESTPFSAQLDNDVFEYNRSENNSKFTFEMPKSSSDFFFDSMYEFPHDYQWELPREKLKITARKLGEGAFGMVYEGLAKDICGRPGLTKVGVKMMKDDFSDGNVVDFVKEIETMKQIGRHRYVIQLFGVCTQNGPLRVIVELAPYGNLRDFLRKKSQKSNGSLKFPPNLSRTTLCIYALQVAQGMTYLSSRSVVHRDLSARNILVGENYDMKIADFGLTRIVDYYYRKKTDGILPVKWMAPEALLEKKYTTKSDVWSYGILLWEIFSLGESPYASVLPEKVIDIVKIGIQNPQPVMATTEVYHVMQQCWNLCSDSRPHFYQIADIIQDILVSVCDEPEQNIYHSETNYLEVDAGYLEPKVRTT